VQQTPTHQLQSMVVAALSFRIRGRSTTESDLEVGSPGRRMVNGGAAPSY
jgi:hypothetical protein